MAAAARRQRRCGRRVRCMRLPSSPSAARHSAFLSLGNCNIESYDRARMFEHNAIFRRATGTDSGAAAGPSRGGLGLLAMPDPVHPGRIVVAWCICATRSSAHCRSACASRQLPSSQPVAALRSSTAPLRCREPARRPASTRPCLRAGGSAAAAAASPLASDPAHPRQRGSASLTAPPT